MQPPPPRVPVWNTVQFLLCQGDYWGHEVGAPTQTPLASVRGGVHCAGPMQNLLRASTLPLRCSISLTSFYLSLFFKNKRLSPFVYFIMCLCVRAHTCVHTYYSTCVEFTEQFTGGFFLPLSPSVNK